MKYPVILCLLFIPFFAQSQSNYHKGSITDNQNQTISGYINYREWDENPKFIEFKSSLDDKTAQSFYPSAIKLFAVDGLEKYYAYKGKISMDQSRLSRLSEGRDTTNKTDVVFLKLITSGDNLTLLSYTDSIKDRYFIQDKQDKPVELSYHEFYNESRSTVLTTDIYKGQLSYLVTKYTNGNSKLLNKVERLKYTVNDITEIINDINGNKAVKSHTPNIRYFVGAALNVSQTGFDGTNALSSANKPTSIAPKLGLGLDIFNNPNIQQFIFRMELTFSYINPKFSGVESGYSAQQATETYSFNQYNATLTPQVIWNVYNKDLFKFYIGVGVGVNLSAYTNNHLSVTGTSGNNDLPQYKLETVWTTFPLQAGVILNKRIELFLTYTAGTSFSDYSFFSLSSNVYSAGIHYLLKRSTKK